MKEVHTSTGEQTVQKYNQQQKKTLLDYFWDFFVSVRVAIVIIVIIALTAVLGTIIPQESSLATNDPANFYAAKYGSYGKFMYQLGFTRMYTSWWFLTLLLLLATSLIICSWERIVPLYKSLKHQIVKKSVVWIKQRNLYAEFPAQATSESPQGNAASAYSLWISGLMKKGYKVRTDEDAFLAEKNRFARFGPYILHIGILIVIVGAFSRVIPGWYFNTDVVIAEGQTAKIPYTDFSVRNNKFTIHYYKDGRPSLYETNATIIKQNQAIKTGAIQVNHDMEYENVQLFQSSYEDPYFQTATISFSKPGAKTVLGSFSMNFEHPKTVYHSGPYTIKVVNYYPEFKMVNNQPTTESNVPFKPTVIFQVEGPGITHPKSQVFFAFFPMLSKLVKNVPVDFSIQNIVENQPTILRVHKDLGTSIVYFGCVVMMFGLILTFYFQHRLVWGRKEGGSLHVGAQSNKNLYGLQKELEKIVSANQGLIVGQGEGGAIFVKHK